MGIVTVQQALQQVTKHPYLETDVLLDMKTHELVARALFDIANSPNARVRGSMARATKAQKLILNRMVGTRRPGSHPAARKGDDLHFVDLTVGVIE